MGRGHTGTGSQPVWIIPAGGTEFDRDDQPSVTVTVAVGWQGAVMLGLPPVKYGSRVCRWLRSRPPTADNPGLSGNRRIGNQLREGLPTASGLCVGYPTVPNVAGRPYSERDSGLPRFKFLSVKGANPSRIGVLGVKGLRKRPNDRAATGDTE